MARRIRVPYRRLGEDLVRAARENRWRSIGGLIDRNFEEITAHPIPEVLEGSVTTTNATTTTALLIPIPLHTTTHVEVVVVARRTGGTAGTPGDGAAYRLWATYKNVSGTAALIGTALPLYVAENQTSWGATLDTSGGNVRVRVTGAANNNVAWVANATLYKVSTL